MMEWGEMRAAWIAGSSPARTNRMALRTDPIRYAVVIENGERNYSAYVPDLPGCVSVGDTAEQVKSKIREAIEFHLEGMREDGLPIPKPSSQAHYVEVGEQIAWAGPKQTVMAGLDSAIHARTRECGRRLGLGCYDRPRV
jgi:predicted RNase H-like HicB family nuclease